MRSKLIRLKVYLKRENIKTLIKKNKVIKLLGKRNIEILHVFFDHIIRRKCIW